MTATARPFTWLDVFTAEPLQGNGLAVVQDADGLPEAVQLAYAQETRLSETTFVQTATAPGADYRNRIWDPREELRFAGHPSLGTAVAVARRRGLDRGTLRQQTPAGVQPVDVEHVEGQRWRTSMLQEPPEHGPELDPAAVLAPVGLGPEAAHPDLPPQVVATGVPQVMCPLSDETAFLSPRPDWDAIDALLGAHEALVLYLVLVAGEGEALSARARGFTGTIAMGEDPATGSAAGPLCAYLAARRGARTVEIVQGVEMGRPSVLRTAVDGDRIRVGGDVVVLAEGTVTLPV